MWSKIFIYLITGVTEQVPVVYNYYIKSVVNGTLGSIKDE